MPKVRIARSALAEVVADLRVHLARQLAIQELIDALDDSVARQFVAVVRATHGSALTLTIIEDAKQRPGSRHVGLKQESGEASFPDPPFTSPHVPTVDPLLPLSLLHAVRNVDTPDDLEAELVHELRNKRLGLSETVYTQIRRYTDAAKRNQRPDQEEAVGLARLIGRRTDAEAVFRAAGQYLAREAYLTIPGMTRKLARGLPSFLARPIVLRRVRKIADRYLNADVRRVGGFIRLEVSDSVTLKTAPNSVGCAFYEASLRELLRLLVGTVGGIEHVQCKARGEGTCEWRAEWR